jgi:hypothetical protein
MNSWKARNIHIYIYIYIEREREREVIICYNKKEETKKKFVMNANIDVSKR